MRAAKSKPLLLDEFEERQHAGFLIVAEGISGGEIQEPVDVGGGELDRHELKLHQHDIAVVPAPREVGVLKPLLLQHFANRRCLQPTSTRVGHRTPPY